MYSCIKESHTYRIPLKGEENQNGQHCSIGPLKILLDYDFKIVVFVFKILFCMLQKRKGRGKTKSSMKRLEAEMAEIGEQQKRVKKGQMEIRERFKEMEFECDQLKKETFLISKQAGRNQQRLNLMFKIVKAREENNISEADKLTQSLRLVLPLPPPSPPLCELILQFEIG